MKKLTNEEYKKVGEDFYIAWSDHEELNPNKIEEEFLDAIDTILFWSRREENKENLDSYDLPSFLDGVKKAVESFNELLHIVDVTKSWKDRKLD